MPDKTRAAIREPTSIQEMLYRVLALAQPRYIRPNDEALQARYGITAVSFWRAVKSGLLPPPKMLNGIRLVDVAETDAAIAKLPTTSTHLEAAAQRETQQAYCDFDRSDAREVAQRELHREDATS